MDTVEFLRGLRWEALPGTVRRRAEHCVLDLCGVAAGGAGTDLSRIVRTHAAGQFGGSHPLAFDGRGASAAGYALALGMGIDALDGHDGFNPAKGHAGCGLFAAALAFAQEVGLEDGREFLTLIVAGYELASRLGLALHASVPDYHTSGAWVAVAAAALGARALGLDPGRTAHALGIAEYHGPRSQMMRCIDHPTMVKDGSGWGAMAGVSAALLARDGFTGAPALTVAEPQEIWSDLGQRWLIEAQYFKPYPVCRWAQGSVEAALALRREHRLTGADVAGIEVETFHEATRLACKAPGSTEEAQYSTSFPVAVALVRGAVGAADVDGAALADPEILRLSHATEMREHDHANARFPAERPARLALRLKDGRRVQGGWTNPRWDAEAPPSAAEFRAKFDDLAGPALGAARAAALAGAVAALGQGGSPLALAAQLAQPISRETTSARAS